MKNINFNVLNKFNSKIVSNDLENTTIIYKVKGGAPSERIDKEIILHADGNVEITVKEDQLGIIPQYKKSTSLNDNETRNIFKEFADSIDKLASDNSLFLPDSVLGSISIEVDNMNTIVGFFLPEENARKNQNKFVESKLSNIINKFESLFE